MAVADFTNIKKQVISRLNLGTASAYSTTIVDDRFSDGELQELILLTDLDVRRHYARSPQNGHWRSMLVASDDIVHRGAIPEHEGVLGDIEIKVSSTDTSYVPPKDDLVSATDIEMYRENPDHCFSAVAHDAVNSPIAAFVAANSKAIQRLQFTGYRARIYYIPLFTIDRATPACQSPEEAAPTIVKGTIDRAIKEGYITGEVFAKFGTLYDKDLVLIHEGMSPEALDNG